MSNPPPNHAQGSSTRTVLRFCQEIETTCAEIYRNYAEEFSEDPELAAFWERIAGEEINHAHIIGIAMRCQGLGIEEQNYDMNRFRKHARDIREILDGLRHIRSSHEDALRAAIHLEQRLAEFHLDHVLKFTDPSEEQFFHQLMEGDKQHVCRLEEAYQKLQGNS